MFGRAARTAVKTKTGRKAGRAGARRVAKAGKGAGKGALKAARAEAKLGRRALSSREPAGGRFLKYGFFGLVGFAIGALLGRSRGNGASSSFTDATGHHTPDPDTPVGQRGRKWGSGIPLDSSGIAGGGHQRPADPNRTGAEREYSDHSTGPLAGEEHNERLEGVREEQGEVEQRIRTRIGGDSRTRDLPRVNVEVNDGVAELRGVAPSEEAKKAVGEIAAQADGVREVRNLVTVGS